jgi:LysM repeat protein
MAAAWRTDVSTGTTPRSLLSFATWPAGIIDSMTDRGVPTADSQSACPFVAFEDDRDERADRPDHRHRCFAEAVPAPRALAHQEAYCLSTAFPVCPTFQEWARREAAHAQPDQARVAAAEAPVEAAAADDDPDSDDLWSAPREVPIEERPRRNPPRDWAAPPPWAAGAGAAGAGAGAFGAAAHHPSDGDAGDPPEEGRGLAGSAADRLARGADPDHAWIGAAAPPRAAAHEPPQGPSAPPDPELAGLVGRRPGGRVHQADADDDPASTPARPIRRPTVSSTRDRSRDRERERERERAAEEREQHEGPSWERSRRYEAYPSIKTRAGLSRVPPLPRITILFGALVIAALLLFLLPSVLNIGGRVGGPGTSASPSAAGPSESLAPTPIPEPTPVVYTIKAGDALARIARRFGVTLEQLMDANPSIKDANKIKVGDKIVIPTPPPEEVPATSASPSASAAAS